MAPQARSNYGYSVHSIPSSLNMKYVDELTGPGIGETARLFRMADDHALGRILKMLGYKYVHVASGWSVTNTSRNADTVVDFTAFGSPFFRSRYSSPILAGYFLVMVKQIYDHFPANDCRKALPIARIQR